MLIKQGDSMAINLITKAEYKAYAGIKSTNYDVEIDGLIPKVSALVKNYCRKTFIDYYDEALTETLDGGTSVLLLKETPVVQVLSVAYSKDFGNTSTELVAGTDYVQRNDQIISTSAQGFPYALNGYAVTYLAGYEQLPQDLKLAVLDLVTYYMRNDSSVHNNRTPGGNGSVQLEYVTNAAFPAHIRRVLDLHVSDYT
jgi:hypothetical protein